MLPTLIRHACGVRLLPAERLPRGPCVFFANHSSHLDFVAIWAALPPEIRRLTRPVAGRDYWEKTRLHRWLALRVFNALLIERQHVTLATNPLQPMLSALDAGQSLIVFPEGTRSGDGALHEFRPGLYHIARSRPRAPLVPVYLANLNRILPKGDFLPVPLIASVVAADALTLGEDEAKPAFLARARTALETLRTARG